jgi:hypothetical protein
MPDLDIINATITVANTKDVSYKRNDGSEAIFKSIGHKNADGTWLNLSVFDEVLFPLIVKGNTLDVGYTEKFGTLANGAPKIDQRTNQQVIYRTMQTASPVGATQTAHPASPGAQAAKEPYNAGLGAYQTALNCSTQLHVAIIGAGAEREDFMAAILEDADTFHTYLTTGKADQLDQMLDKAKQTFEDAPIGFDDKPDPDGSEEFGF